MSAILIGSRDGHLTGEKNYLSGDVTGKMINTIPVNCKETNLSIEAGSIATGTYAYALYIDGKLIDTKKMVLTK